MTSDYTAEMPALLRDVDIRKSSLLIWALGWALLGFDLQRSCPGVNSPLCEEWMWIVEGEGLEIEQNCLLCAGHLNQLYS